MEVSMDGLRWQLLSNYNSLVRKLNRSIKKYDTFDNEITIDPDEIQRDLDGLRECIVGLSYTYMEGHFDCLKDPQFETFNEEDDEE
jgi:hypothetical protein